MKRLIGVSALLAGLFLTPAVGRAQGTTFTACVGGMPAGVGCAGSAFGPNCSAR